MSLVQKFSHSKLVAKRNVDDDSSVCGFDEEDDKFNTNFDLSDDGEGHYYL